MHWTVVSQVRQLMYTLCLTMIMQNYYFTTFATNPSRYHSDRTTTPTSGYINLYTLAHTKDRMMTSLGYKGK